MTEEQCNATRLIMDKAQSLCEPLMREPQDQSSLDFAKLRHAAEDLNDLIELWRVELAK